MRKAAITGATSMLGIALIQACISRGVHCLCFVRPHSKNLNRLPVSPFITVAECDLADLESYAPPAAQCGCEVFYHLGWGSTSKTTRNSPEAQCANITHTLAAVHLAKKLGCHTFAGIGSQAEYGRVNAQITPNTPVNPDVAYGVAKYAAGRLSSILCSQLGLRHIWGRVFSVYGPWDNEGTLLRTLLESLLRKQSPAVTKSEQLWDYLFAEDAGEAIFLMGEKGHDGSVYNIGNSTALPLRSYIEVAWQAAGTPCEILYGAIPYAPTQVMHLCADISTLTADTGFAPKTAFAYGIQKTIEWMKEQQKND